MGRTSARALRRLGTSFLQTGRELIDQLVAYTKEPAPTYSEEEALGYLSEPEKLGYQNIMNWLTGKDETAASAEGLINQILAGNLYEQPGVKSSFEKAIEAPIMDVLREQTMPQIAASAGKGGTYFSTMRSKAEIDAQQAAADKIAELESGYILQQMTNAINTGLALPAAKATAGTTTGAGLRQNWKSEQPYYGGGNVPLITSILASNQPYASEGASIAQQYEAIASQERQARAAGISSGFGSAMGAGGGAAGGGCCFMFIMGEGGITDDVQRFKHSYYPYHSDVANGYRFMSIKLMPYIKRNKFVKTLVKRFITNPISKFAKYYYKKDLKSIIYAPSGLFWTTTWGLLGRLSTYNSKPYQEMVKKLGI